MKRKLLLLSVFICSFTFGQNVNIPDQEFKLALLNYSPSIDTNNDNQISVTEAAAVTMLDISGYHYNMQPGDPNDPNGGGGFEIFGISDFTGIEAFVNLTSLTCNNNDLTILDVSTLTQLITLDCSNNRNPFGYSGGITTLMLPNSSSIQNLNCSNNYITSLDVSSFTSLIDLNIEGNQIPTLELSNISTLQFLKCGSNQLTILDVSQNTSITSLSFFNNSLNSIDLNNLSALTILDCRQNQLTTLDISQSIGLTILDCSNNQLTALDVSANTAVTSIKCSTNQITDLDLSYLPNLVYIRAFTNALTSLNLKNGNNNNMSSAGFWVTNNPNLQLICVDDITYASTNFTNKDAIAYFSDICSFIPANSNTITGRVSFDFNNDGCDPTDVGSINTKITTTGTNTANVTFTDNSGNYTLYPLESSVTTEIFLNLPSFFTVTPTTQASNFTGSGTTDTIDFCITANSQVNDAEIQVYSTTESRPGFDTCVQVIYRNTGSTILSGVLTLNFNNNQESFLNASTNPDTQTTNSLSWNYNNLLPFESQTIDICFNINTPTDPTNPVNGGDIISYTTSITSTTGTLATANGTTFVFDDFVVNSHDPNDVICFKGDKISEAQVPEFLTYRIRFQNTGTASAINIKVKDLLDTNLDWSTFQPISASHPYRVLVENGNDVSFIFENIHLADSTSNEPSSHGWLLYKIKPKSTVVLGDDFQATAHIFFDYNPAVITNTATTTVSTVTNIPDANFEQELINLGYDSGAIDGVVFTANINTITNLDVSNKNIADFTGIEDFTGLTTLNVSSNQLTVLNVNQNTSLIDLDCKNNMLTSLLVKNSNNINFTNFDAINNPNLTCIEVDNVAYSIVNWTNIDTIASFNHNCTNPETYVPDDNFENYLETHNANGGVVPLGDATSMGNGIANDNYVTTANINTVTNLEVININIADLTGIEGFLALLTLNCSENQIITLDLNINTALTSLNCDNNQLTNLEVSQNTVLTTLIFSQNQITSIDISSNIYLEYLACAVNSLTTLDLSTNTALTGLNCAVNSLTTLDLSTNTALTFLYCNANQLTTLDLSVNTALVSLSCSGNQIVNLDLSTNTALTSLVCPDNQLTNLNVKNGNNINIHFTDFATSGNPNLTCIEVDDAVWSTANWTLFIDATSNFSENCATFGLTYVPDDNFENYLETHNANGGVVPLGDATSMGNGIANDDYVTTANINTVTNLNVSILSIVDLTGVEDFVALTVLNCKNNQLTALNISANTALTDLDCSSNQLTTLDVSVNTALNDFRFTSNQLISIDVSQNTALTKLYCDQNQLTTINIDNNTLLTQFNCYNNQISVLNVLQNPQLTYLDCRQNQLTSLDVSNNLNLTILYCSVNQITSLDVSLSTSLYKLVCDTNQLTSLNVKNGNNINFTQFLAQDNPNLTCIEVDNAAYSTASWTNIDAIASFNHNCTNPETYVPDDNFENYLETHDAYGVVVALGDATSMGNGIANDDYVTTANINTVTNLDVGSLSIADLTGLEDFVNLAVLYCHDNQLNSLDISSNILLTRLYCGFNQLTSIDITQNILLIELYSQSNQLTQLNTTNNTLLKKLYSENNQLTILDITSNNQLTHLVVNNNLITNLDVTQNVNLKTIEFHTNQVSSIDLTQNTLLESLKTGYNLLTSLNLSNNTYLQIAQIENNQISTLNLTPSSTFVTLMCQNNLLPNLDLSLFSSFVYLNCSSNLLTSLNVKNGNNVNFNYFNSTNNPNLTCIEVDNAAYSTTNWTSIDNTSTFSTHCPLGETYVPDDNFENFLETHNANGGVVPLGDATSMGNGIANDDYVTTANINTATILFVNNKSISDLTGIEDFVSLTHLYCSNNQLTSLNVTLNTSLYWLECDYNQIVSLDTTQNLVLDKLQCNNNQLSGLDVSQNTSLTFLNCSSNMINNIDVTQNIGLTIFACGSNQLTSLDITQNTALNYFSCRFNQLTSINLTQNILLTNVLCNNNLIIDLDITQNTVLTELSCYNNLLTGLNAKNGNNTSIQYFKSFNNPNLTCIEVDNVAYSTTNWTEIDPASTFVNNQVECASLSVQDEAQTAFSIYPNPTTNSVQLTVKEQAVYRLYTLNGRLLQKGNLSVGNNNIDMKKVAIGVYMIQVQTEKGITSKKIIKN